MLSFKLFVTTAAIALVWADQNAGFDKPGEPEEDNKNTLLTPTFYNVGSQVEIAWHMNFTDALLKLHFAPDDGDYFNYGSSVHILSEPTNVTSYLWTVSTYEMNNGDNDDDSGETTGSFYLSITSAVVESHSFISRVFAILPEEHVVEFVTRAEAPLIESGEVVSDEEGQGDGGNGNTGDSGSDLPTSTKIEIGAAIGGAVLLGGTTAYCCFKKKD